MFAHLKAGLRVLLLAAPPLVLLAQPQDSAPRRAKPPRFDKSPVANVFFENVLEHVTGERPVGGAVPPAVAEVRRPSSTASAGEAGPGGNSVWSQLISATVLEDEVKSLKLAVDEAVTTPGRFQSQGYRAAHDDFGILAVLFGIIARYEGDVRWKEQAPAARDLFARAAANTAVGSAQVFNEARQRRQDLQDLVSGARLTVTPDVSSGDWSTIVERAALMRRLETAYQINVTPIVNSAAEFSGRKSALLHEAQMIAALAEVLQQPGMMDADDDTYAEFAEQMKQAALAIVEAARQENYEAARQAAGEVSKSCSQCHELYRG